MAEPKDILKKIKEEKIQPRPKWEILVKNYSYWVLLGLMVLFGAVAVSILILSLLDLQLGLRNGFSLGRYMHLLFITMPFAWLLLGTGALVSGVMAFRKTKHGYRYRNLFVVAIGVLLVSMLAVTAHFTKFSRRVENAFDRSVPGAFHGFIPSKEGRFFHPEEGLIAGRIIQIGNQYFILLNHTDERWEVLVDDETEIIGADELEEGLRVLVSGEGLADDVFEAEAVQVMGPGMGRPNMGPGMIKRDVEVQGEFRRQR